MATTSIWIDSYGRKWWSTLAIARQLDCHPQTVRRFIHKDQTPVRLHGRHFLVSDAEAQALISRHSVREVVL